MLSTFGLTESNNTKWVDVKYARKVTFAQVKKYFIFTITVTPNPYLLFVIFFCFFLQISFYLYFYYLVFFIEHFINEL